jgi:two-component system NarL family sensor kinase
MRPLELDQLGLSGALRQLALEFAERSGLSVHFEDAEAPVDLSEDAKVALFRIAQEGLANAARHAQAGQVTLRLSQSARETILEVHDNGVGFDVARVGRSALSGIGLRNLRERVEHLGGRLSVRSEPGHTRLRIHLPASEQRGRS